MTPLPGEAGGAGTLAGTSTRFDLAVRGAVGRAGVGADGDGIADVVDVAGAGGTVVVGARAGGTGPSGSRGAGRGGNAAPGDADRFAVGTGGVSRVGAPLGDTGTVAAPGRSPEIGAAGTGTTGGC